MGQRFDPVTPLITPLAESEHQGSLRADKCLLFLKDNTGRGCHANKSFVKIIYDSKNAYSIKVYASTSFIDKYSVFIEVLAGDKRCFIPQPHVLNSKF